jgi:glutamate formiminotransferase
MAQIIECVPNFSEGRRSEVVDDIVAAIRSVEGVTLLDRSSDADHNRSVVTFVGAAAAVEEAAYRGIAKAAELIDMERTPANIRVWARPMWCRSFPLRKPA